MHHTPRGFVHFLTEHRGHGVEVVPSEVISFVLMAFCAQHVCPLPSEASQPLLHKTVQSCPVELVTSMLCFM